jgi:hypothetical protein
VTLPLELNEPMRSAADFDRLVRAVHQAHPDEPETDALEWKSAWDLRQSAARFETAKHLLAFGNRPVEVARRSFGGHAYLLIGVEPQHLTGAAHTDPAELHDAIALFVGADQPRWTPIYVTLEDKRVLVLEVDAPEHGDHICTLRREHGNARPGRIFVRRHGKSEEAGPDDIRALEERVARPYVDAAARAIAANERAAQSAEQSLELQRREADAAAADRADRAAPRFGSSPLTSDFVYSAPDEVSGALRNNGGTAAIIRAARLQHPGGAVPGAMAPLYGSGTVEAPMSSSARVEPG